MRCGSETEFAVCDGRGREGAKAIQADVSDRFACLPSVKGGVFLQNGAQVYVDLGGQPEYATPEVSSPRDLVLYELAGRQLMSEAAERKGISILCSNVDPQTGSTCGCHENYEMRWPPTPAALLAISAHLVTRIVLTGAGGLDPTEPGITPVLSPRASRLVACFERQGHVRKSLVFMKPDNYGAGHRLHVFSGESLLSPFASYIKYATTALVTAAMDRGLSVRWPLLADSPLRVLRQINRDLSLNRRFRMTDGRFLSALQIQRHLVSELSRFLGELPDWAVEATAHWQTALADLEERRFEVACKYDWMLTLRLVEEIAEDLGTNLDDVVAFNRELRFREQSGERRRLLPAALFHLRGAANELYIRLHLLGPQSLYDRLVAERGYSCGVRGVTQEAMREAMHQAPAGRASCRAKLVRRAAAYPAAVMSWGQLYDRPGQRTLVIPNEEDDGWENRWVPDRPSMVVPDSLPLFRAGHYAACIARLWPHLDELVARRAIQELHTLALSFARCGLFCDFDRLFRAHQEAGAPAFCRVELEVFCRASEGLVPSADRLRELIARGDALVAEAAPGTQGRWEFEQCRGVALAASGDTEGALLQFEKWLANERYAVLSRMTARTRCFAAEMYRRLGVGARARSLADLALATHRDEDMQGDRAVHSLPLLARLEQEDDVARALLLDAELDASASLNELARVRVLCTKARRLRCGDDRETIRRMRDRLPSLKQCPVMSRVLACWNEWIAGPGTAGPDDYWGML